MNDQSPSPASGIMKAAASAATKVSSWSQSKQEFATRVTNTGSFANQNSSASDSGSIKAR